MPSINPEKFTCHLNIHMLNHAKNWLNSTSLSQANKIMKFIKLGVTQIVTPLFKNSYLNNQVSKNHKLYIKITIKVSRICTKNFIHFFESIIILWKIWQSMYQCDTTKQTLGILIFYTCTKITKIMIKFYTLQGAWWKKPHKIWTRNEWFVNF